MILSHEKLLLQGNDRMVPFGLPFSERQFFKFISKILTFTPGVEERVSLFVTFKVFEGLASPSDSDVSFYRILNNT